MSLSTALLTLFGGALIGGAASILLLVEGRIAGVSGILRGLISPEPQSWRMLFLGGFLVGGLVLYVFSPATVSVHLEQPWWFIMGAGLLVGFGTQLGGGCTSGHGVCGLGRRSPRSLVAVGVFMATAAVATTLVKHVFI
ncbi:MAG: YeeE/YedE family protein [Deltaproteobacteria bacterium]|nr:YeeE/YedE family protein [Deltaproteobacteria bacterium]